MFQFHMGLTSVILPRMPLLTIFLAAITEGALRLCIPTWTICEVLRTASIICLFCSRERDIGFSR